MKIDSSIKPVGVSVGETRREPARPAAGGSKTSQSAEVAISPLSSRLQAMEGAMASAPVVNSERVDAIRQAIAAGTFQVDTSRIADGLIDSVRQLLGSQH